MSKGILEEYSRKELQDDQEKNYMYKIAKMIKNTTVYSKNLGAKTFGSA